IADAVRQVIEPIENCNLEQLSEYRNTSTRLRRGGVGLILACARNATNKQQIERLLADVTASDGLPPVIVLSEQVNTDLRQQLLRLGAADFMSAPPDRARLALLVDVLTVRARYQGPRGPVASTEPESAVDAASECFSLGTSAMSELIERIHLIAPLDTTVLITGETGTGKTHLARVLHQLSHRKQKPFVVIPCGSLSPTLVESEMFGHVRGAFTHAEQDRVGKFAHAEDGTLLLDEIDCVPLESQAKLLRSFEERVFEPVGSNESQKLRARLVVASNRPLEEEVEAGRFRSDLYYRLNVVDFRLPPLRERTEMIEPLAEKFLAELSPYEHRPYQAFSSRAIAAMQSHAWPGNVRELRNVVEQAVAFCSDRTIDLADLPERVRSGFADDTRPAESGTTSGNRLAQARREGEKGRLVQALRRNNNNRSHAAVELGISRVTLYKKLNKYGIA
ncbi:MAG TPA: sigma-54 dependent transcriptional regulator, partial [Thermoguttaceae bacterium]|nr:sigma-54 dependent transcriptional regulator [Thermoguttaceae bacterium]